MLLLFSEVGERDAPTRIRVGSQTSIARRLARAAKRASAPDHHHGAQEQPTVPRVKAAGLSQEFLGDTPKDRSGRIVVWLERWEPGGSTPANHC